MRSGSLFGLSGFRIGRSGFHIGRGGPQLTEYSGDGELPTNRPFDNIYALNDDMTLNFIGWVGHMAFQSPHLRRNVTLIRVDYEKYFNGEDYII